jgi:hypothetical protein
MTTKEPTIPWNTFPEGRIIKQSTILWAVRTGVVVNRPRKQKCFEDSSMLLSSLEGENNSVLGYLLQTKHEFPNVFPNESYVSFFSEVEKHKNPKVLYKDQKVYLYRFNSTKSPSYWFLFRNRTS